MVFDLGRCLIYKTIVYNKPITLLYVLIQGFENLEKSQEIRKILGIFQYVEMCVEINRGYSEHMV